ncbi:uncharacterized protein LOC126829946 [Patella vulgata]|uniref:uncharacterized protein LOC126829946 n=1 Tax=Patella vulgata TaxID=6465 RepID=UPI0024A82347|nr:uncharacterized protein LOC126829946 [Patella vulgata]XP_050416103.2 uncharacterized protein LOC126829946 [Patella vulgata]
MLRIFRVRQKMKKIIFMSMVGMVLFMFSLQLKQLSIDSKVKIQKFVKSIHRLSNDVNMETIWRNSNGKHNGHCKIPYLKKMIRPAMSNTSTRQEVTCHRVKPHRESCQIADDLFKSKPIGTCSHQKNYEFCKIYRYESDAMLRDVTCSINQCVLPVYLGQINKNTGEKIWTPFTSAIDLTHGIYGIRKQGNFGFFYIKCVLSNENSDLDTSSVFFDQDEGVYFVLQLILLPPMYINSTEQKKMAEEKINVNIIFVDSVSRHHFYRSLPKTVDLFSNLNTNTKTKVLDFELTQSVRSRTFETLQAMFSGYVNLDEKPFGVLAMPPVALKTEELLGKFKEKGYKTLWLEDLCYLWEWGIVKDLLVHDSRLSRFETWTKLKAALLKANIDSLDITLTSCEVMLVNNHNDPFHDLDTVCFNGRHHHEYFLEYLQIYQTYLNNMNLPFFTFYETNVAHEDTGRRIQTLDVHLEDFLNFARNQPNTLTVVMSDHGNSYGDFLQRSEEGQRELYHPSMFLIIPEKVARYLGDEKMKNLIENQNRLISHLDLFYTLNSLLIGGEQVKVANRNQRFNVTSLGLFDQISPHRTCSDMPMINPNLCICEGFESTVSNNTDYVVYAHFALGKINNEIQREYREHHRHSVTGVGHCQQLRLYQFTNVRKSLHDNRMTLKMNLEVQSGVSNGNETDIFFVTMSIETGNHNITLQQVERISGYSRYKTCADEGVSLPFCVCDITSPHSTNQKHLSLEDLEEDILLMQSSIHHIENKCLYLVSNDNQVGLVLYAVNICKDLYFDISVDVQHIELDISTSLPVKTQVFPGEIQFLTSGVRSSPNSKWLWSYSISFTDLALK